MAYPIQHQAYTLWAPTWTLLRDVYEGAGGFLHADRPYLRAHPREFLDALTGNPPAPNPTPRLPTPKLTARRRLARYENIAATIVDTLAGALFRQPPQRVVGDGSGEGPLTPIEQFWANADGHGHSLTTVLRQAWTASAVFGHAFLVLDRPDGQEVRDQQSALPYVRLYTPLDVVDWLTDDEGALTAVLVAEALPRTGFDQTQVISDTNVVYRSLDATQWQVMRAPKDAPPEVLDAGPHGFGALPVVVLYGQPRALTPVIGSSVLGDPYTYVDLYNLTSEVRELLRNQTFGQMAVQLGPDADFAAEHQRLQQGYGTSNAIVSSGTVSYVSPDPENVRVYHEHMDRLIRTIFRCARLPYEGDSKQVESGDSRQLKREDLNTTLADHADELQRKEMALVELVYRGVYGERWQKQLDADVVTVTYPDQFDPTPFETLAARFTTVIGMDAGETAQKEVKKRTIREALPDLAPATLDQIDREIDAQEYLSKAEQQQRQLDAAVGRLAQGTTKGSTPLTQGGGGA